MRFARLPTQATPVAAAISAALLICTPDRALAQTLEDVVVSASRTEQRSFDAPGSIQSVDRESIQSRGPQINISEALVEVPGIHVANRNNFSQDLQISIRGFGSRAPFGVRGVRLLIDGIPQTLPDGQGQSSQFALTSAERIEVLKGPLSLLYGNAAGGVVQVFTRSATARPQFDASGYIGSDGLYRSSVQYSEQKGHYGLVADLSAIESDGFRSYSAASRQHFNGKIEYADGPRKTVLIANILRNDSQEPGSLTRAEFDTNPFQAVSANVTNRYGKVFEQGSLGLVNDYVLSDQRRVSTRAYWGYRSLDNPLGASTSSTGFSIIDRQFYGLGVSLTQRAVIANIPTSTILGLEADFVEDDRSARTNQAGVATGALGRQERNLANNTDAIFQSQIFLNDHYTATAGLRISRIELEVKDRFLSDSDGDGSGKKRYSGVSPVLGLTRHVSPSLNAFIQFGRGFETPTLNEVLYTPNNTSTPTNRFYSGLSAARSQQVELGLKWRPDTKTRLDASIFQARTRDDIVPYYLSTSSSAWQNADTQRYGAELAGLTILNRLWAIRGALSFIDATYRESISTVRATTPVEQVRVDAGNTMPGVPRSRAFAELAWRSSGWMHRATGDFSEAGLEWVAAGEMQANSANTEKASGYELLNMRAATHFRKGAQQLSLYARVDNLLDRRYVGSVVSDQAFLRFYEPGAPRNWLLGLRYTLSI
jgi:iron complex outermembrane receptor protein